MEVKFPKFMSLFLFVTTFYGSFCQKMVEEILENNVAVVTKNNLEYLINKNRILLIMCYVPWDMAYQERIEDYEQFAKAAHQSTDDIMLAKLDIASDPGAAAVVDVRIERGMQFIFFRKGVSYNFADYRDRQTLAKKLKIITNPNWTPPEIFPEDNRVKDMTKKDFSNDLTTKSFAVVLFYKQGSLASKRLIYDFEIAASKVDVKNGIKQSFFKFDASEEVDILKKYDVGDLPNFKIFRNGKAYDYNGMLMNPTEMKNYIEKHMGPPFTTLGDPKELDAFLKKNSERSTVVGFFASLDLPSFPHFFEAAQTLRDRYNFVLMSTPMVKNGDGEPQQAPGWTLAVFLPKHLHTPDDEKRSILQYENADYAMIVDFIKWKATSLAGERTLQNMGTTYSLRPLVVVYGKIDWSKAHRKETEYLRDKVASAAKDHKDTLFAISDIGTFQTEVTRFGFDIQSGKYDLHVGILGKDGEYYPRWDTTHMNAKMISEFVKQYREGEIKPFYRSNATSAALAKVGSLKELTGDSFEADILESPNHALILFYHPLSKHWRLAQSVLKDLAEDIGYKRQGIVFSEMDVSRNDAPAYFTYPTFPIIYFVPKNDKDNRARLSGEVCGEYGIRQFLKEQIAKAEQSEKKPLDFTGEKPVKTEL